MSKSPAFQFYPNDWLSSPRVAMMNHAQQGVYIRLLCFDWANDGLPDDDTKLAALAGVTDWDRGGYALVKACFIGHPSKTGFITSERLQKEREKQAQWREKSILGGKKGAAKRWGKTRSKENRGGHQMVITKPSPKHDQTYDQTIALQSSSSVPPTKVGGEHKPPPAAHTTSDPASQTNGNRPTLQEAQAFFARSKFSKDDVRQAWAQFEAAKRGEDGAWMWGRRTVTDWRWALESRMNDNLDRKPGHAKTGAKQGGTILDQLIREI